MAKAFYPTNDGHIGNLGNLATIEIYDMIKRQQDLVKKNKRFMSRLPDNGKRIKGLLEKLQKELSRRDTQATDNKADDSVDCGNPEYTQGNQHTNIDIQKDCTPSEARPVCSLRCTDAPSQIKPVESIDALSQIKPSLGSTDAHSCQNKPRELEKDLQKLSLVDDDQSKEVVTEVGSLNDSDESRQWKHHYEVAVERATKNLQSRLRQPFKLNRTLKIEHVKDLPEEITRMKIHVPHIVSYDKKEQKKIEYDRGTTHPVVPRHPVNEESSAVPPCYKFSRARMIELTESLQLQEQQKQHQEELNAELAATKLAERLHVKMEEYNPEGVDMSYRHSRDGHFADDLNSDDDDDDDDDNNDSVCFPKMTTLSDTED